MAARVVSVPMAAPLAEARRTFAGLSIALGLIAKRRPLPARSPSPITAKSPAAWMRQLWLLCAVGLLDWAHYVFLLPRK